MPFPNEHAARQTEPEQYDEFRRYTPKGAPAGSCSRTATQPASIP